MPAQFSRCSLLVSPFPGAMFPALRCLCVLAALFPGTIGLAEPPTVKRPSTSDFSATQRQHNDFQQTVDQAGLIFEGTVTAIQPELGNGKIPQTYRITFLVRNGLRGVRTGASFSIREWAGLWTPGTGQPSRYRVGERAFLFLYPPGRAGLTSTVSGRKGKLTVTAGRVALPSTWLASLGPPPTSAGRLPTDTATAVPVEWFAERVSSARALQKGGE